MLNRCIVGHFGQEITEKVTLADIRRWCSQTWKAVFEVNIYEMSSEYVSFLIPVQKYGGADTKKGVEMRKEKDAT